MWLPYPSFIRREVLEHETIGRSSAFARDQLVEPPWLEKGEHRGVTL